MGGGNYCISFLLYCHSDKINDLQQRGIFMALFSETKSPSIHVVCKSKTNKPWNINISLTITKALNNHHKLGILGYIVKIRTIRNWWQKCEDFYCTTAAAALRYSTFHSKVQINAKSYLQFDKVKLGFNAFLRSYNIH